MKQTHLPFSSPILRKNFISVLLMPIMLFLILHESCAQSPLIKAYLRKMDSAVAFNQASWGFCLLSGKNGSIIATYHADKSLVPASVQKVFTTATSIALLGDTFRFKTSLLAEGEISKEGVLFGNIIVKGHGDPVLGSSKGSNQSMWVVAEEFFLKIKMAGIKEIKGDVLADISYFEYEPVPAYWTWYDIGNYYAPTIGALNIGENMYELWFKPGTKEGDSTKFLRTVPAIPGLRIVNHTTTAIGGGDQTFIPGPPRATEKHVYGKMPLGESFKIKGATPQPEQFFLSLLKDSSKFKLPIIRLEISYQSSLALPRKMLYTHYSPQLLDLCRYANYTSNNLTAECLLRTLGAERGKGGSTMAGIEVLQKYVSNKVANPTGLKLVDGSGLSKYNLVTASQLASFLASVQKEPWFKKFYATLPQSGVNGTLEKFCEGTKAEGKVAAKSGSMERVKCYTGYVKDKQGNLNPFAILVNNHHVPNREIVKWIEGLMELCVE